MILTMVDLRNHPGKILEALNHNENVLLTYRGKKVAKIVPVEKEETSSALNHPSFGMWKNNDKSVKEVMREIRKPRYDGI